MALQSFLKIFMPKNKIFYELFEKVADNAAKMGSILRDIVAEPDFDKRGALILQVEDLEHANDELTHNIFTELGRNFITPFDREDIHSLIKAVDNVADYMHSAASKMRLYQVEKITKSIRKLTEINLEACQLIGLGIKELKEMNHKSIKETCKKINKLESKADSVFDKAVADIFENENDAKNIIKYKEVLSALESASDKCKSVSNVMEQISVKHS